MIYYSDILKIVNEYREWLSERKHVSDCYENFVEFMKENDLLKDRTECIFYDETSFDKMTFHERKQIGIVKTISTGRCLYCEKLTNFIDYVHYPEERICSPDCHVKHKNNPKYTIDLTGVDLILGKNGISKLLDKEPTQHTSTTLEDTWNNDEWE